MRVVPVLVEGAAQPTDAELPSEIKALALRVLVDDAHVVAPGISARPSGHASAVDQEQDEQGGHGGQAQREDEGNTDHLVLLAQLVDRSRGVL